MNQTVAITLDNLADVSHALNQGLANVFGERLPAEIQEALEMAKSEMAEIPLTIFRCEMAKKEFVKLDKAIDRQIILAEKAVSMPDDDQAARQKLQDEFVDLAREIAHLAARQDYDTPQLNLMDKASAVSAGKMLEYLKPVKVNMATELKQQESNIMTALAATQEFFEAVKLAYPEAAVDLTDQIEDQAAANMRLNKELH